MTVNCGGVAVVCSPYILLTHIRFLRSMTNIMAPYRNCLSFSLPRISLSRKLLSQDDIWLGMFYHQYHILDHFLSGSWLDNYTARFYLASLNISCYVYNLQMYMALLLKNKTEIEYRMLFF